MTKSATKEGTRRYAQRFAARAASGHFREAQRMLLSSLGLGTYLGQPDKMTDEAYTAAVVAAAESGINLFDSAINYRFQRSERSIGAALEQLAAKGFSREELVLATKGGYLTPDGSMPADANEYFFREYIQPGIFTAKDLAAGSHCMAPKFLKDQLGRSLKNLRVECLDVYYLHNPETQLDRKSTRLNSSHGYISYAVFCLKKKKTTTRAVHLPLHVSPSDAATLDSVQASLLVCVLDLLRTTSFHIQDNLQPSSLAHIRGTQ